MQSGDKWGPNVAILHAITSFVASHAYVVKMLVL